jgi:DNA ligase (NAD+)
MADKVLQRIQSLREQLEHHHFHYFVEAKPQISDREFDRLMRELYGAIGSHSSYEKHG